MSASKHDDDLSRLLREGDPLAEEPGLNHVERVAMRRTVLSQVPERTTSIWRQLSPALSVAVLLALALAIPWRPTTTEMPVATSGSQEEVDPSLAEYPPSPGIQRAGNSLETRKIQFETPGGTLVVWVLNPNFPS